MDDLRRFQRLAIIFETDGWDRVGHIAVAVALEAESLQGRRDVWILEPLGLVLDALVTEGKTCLTSQPYVLGLSKRKPVPTHCLRKIATVKCLSWRFAKTIEQEPAWPRLPLRRKIDTHQRLLMLVSLWKMAREAYVVCALPSSPRSDHCSCLFE